MKKKAFTDNPVCAIDALGRKIPSPGKTDDLRQDRKVGIFYFLWHSGGNERLYNISEITSKDPLAGYKVDDPMWGKVREFHYWGEPFYG